VAFTDPQTVTIDGTAHVLPRSFSKTGIGQFVGPDGTYALEIAPSNGKTKVRVARLRGTKIASDPLVSTVNVRVTDLISLTIIRPNDGYSDAEVVKQVVGFFNLLTANTNANLVKLIAGEN